MYFGRLESIHLSVTHTVPLSARQSPCQFSGLRAPPVRGLPWATDRAPLRVETGFGGGSVGFRRTNRLPQYSSLYASEPQFVCSAPHLRFTCLNPDEDGGQQGERNQRRGGIFSSRQRLSRFFLRFVPQGRKKN